MGRYRGVLIAMLLTVGCAGAQVGTVDRPLATAIPVTLDEGCDQAGHTVSIQGALLRDDLLYVQYYRGHGCDTHAPQVCRDGSVERPAVRFQVRDVTDDQCEAEAVELIAVDGIPDGLELQSFGGSAVDAELPD